MRIGIEAQRIFRKNKHGKDYVVLQEIKELQQIDHVNEYYVFVKPGEDHCVESTKNIHVIELKCPSYPLWEQWALPKAAKKYALDILHCTSNTAPVWCDIPLVLTLHDIIFLEPRDKNNKSLYQNMGWFYRRWNVPRILSKCRRIITVSNFEMENIISKLGIPRKRMVMIYNGYNEWFKPIDNCDLPKELYIEPEVFSKQMDFLLKHNYIPITLEDLLKSYKDNAFKLPKKSVLITFDDGWLDNYTNSFPILKEKNVKANIFISCDFIEQKNCMTWNQLLEMKNSGLISFGSHTLSHPTDIQTLDDDKILQELKISKQQLEQKLNIKIDSFAYPSGAGAINKKIRQMVFDSGYLFDFSTKRGITPFKWNKEKAIKRLYIKQSHNLFDFYLLITKGKNSF